MGRDMNLKYRYLNFNSLLVEMAFTGSHIEAKDVNGYFFDYENYDGNSFSPCLYDDPLQTVPDLEAFAMQAETQTFFRGQRVPDSRLQRRQVQTDDETTPVRIDGLLSKTCRITPRCLNFEDGCSDVTSLRQYVGGEHNENNDATLQQRRQQHDAPGKAKKKSKRRSYLSIDLPEEIRNQRRTVANARERARVGRMANGYGALETALPKYLTKPKMRKVDILNSAVCHIQNLMRMLADSRYDCNENRPVGMLPTQNYTDFHADFTDMTQYNVDNCSFLE